jgi:hypothetical protein
VRDEVDRLEAIKAKVVVEESEPPEDLNAWE